MGNCLGQSTDQESSNNRNAAISNRKKVIAKSQPLRKDKFKWKSDIPLTSYHIMAKREEFWDTAPAFDGRQEIWDALKAAVEAIEKGDYELAQAIIDGANIILPSGNLRDCYDELGNRYQLPLYVLGFPSNMYEPPPPTQNNDNAATLSATTPTHDSKSSQKQSSKRHSTSSASSSTRKSHNRHHRRNNNNNSSTQNNPTTTISSIDLSISNIDNNQQQPQSSQSLVTLKLRLSTTGKDYKLITDSTLPVIKVKEQFSTIINYPADRQRWFCYGRMIENHLRLCQCTIPPDFIIQVIVNEPPTPSLTTSPLQQQTIISQ